MGRAALLVPLVAVTLLSACGGSDEESEPANQAAGERMQISETEYALDPSSIRTDAGTVTFHVVNNGSQTHALEVEGEGIEEQTEEIGPGESADLTVDLSKAGSYELYCPIDGHRERGMEATLTVGGAPAATGTETDESGSGGSNGYG